MKSIAATVLLLCVTLGASPIRAQDSTPAEVPKAAPPQAKKAAAKKPTASRGKPAPLRKIGPVSVVESDPNFVQLEGPWTGTYPQRTWLTSYMPRQGGPLLHRLTLELTHHTEAARNYAKVQGRPPAEGLAIAPRQPPSLQCTVNRGGDRVCFHTEVYSIDLPDKMLIDGANQGVDLELSAPKAEPLSVRLDTAQIDAQMKAIAAVDKKPATAVAAKPPAKPAAKKPAAKKAATTKKSPDKPAADTTAGKAPAAPPTPD